jgi:ABC-type branched-subunit amino acid transport system ATPase component/predicted MFS family arabinose efflux permease
MAGDAAPGAGPGELFDFTVPDELLKEAVSRQRDPEVVADLALMPGTGEGKPPPLAGVFHQAGYAPLVLMTLAAFVPGMISNGLGVLGPDVQRSFHLNLAELGAVTFVAAVAQIGWGLPVAIAGDRGSRKIVTAITLLVFAVALPFMAAAPNVWVFVFAYLIAAVAFGTSDTVMNSYLADAYPTEARARVFALRNISDPLAQTVGVGVMTFVAATTGSWRWSLLVGLVAIPVACLLFGVREPAKGQNESHHILTSSGMDIAGQQAAAPKVLFSSAVTRIMRIRSLYYELVAVAILGFAGTGIPLFGSIYYSRVWHQNTGERGHIYVIIGLSAFVGIPMAWAVGDRLFRRAPQRPLQLAAVCITAFGGLFTLSLYMPSLWLVVMFQFLANVAVAPLAISLFQTLAATAPPEMRSITFALFGVYGLVFGGFAGAVVLGAFADAAGVTAALTVIGPVCAAGGVLLWLGSRHVRRDITLVIEDVLERYAEGRRRQTGGAIPALQVHNLDFFYGSNQVLFDVNVEVAEGEIVALLGTNGAGKSTLLRAVAGLDHPHRGVIRIFGVNSTYLEPEQIIGESVALLVGGKMTFPGLTVRDNLRVGEYTLRRDGPRARAAMSDALDLFPELATRINQPAGTLSGGEQQMLALARVMMTTPRLLMIDELALGLAPKTVDRLMEIVRRVNADGTTVILVEQSVNRAMSLAEHAFFLERGEIRFDGPTAELLARDDLLRPVFLAEATAGLR